MANFKRLMYCVVLEPNSIVAPKTFFEGIVILTSDQSMKLIIISSGLGVLASSITQLVANTSVMAIKEVFAEILIRSFVNSSYRSGKVSGSIDTKIKVIAITEITATIFKPRFEKVL